MADEAGPPPGGEAKAGADEVDVVRATIYFLCVLLAGLGVVYLVLLSKRDGFREAVAWGEKDGKRLAGTYDEVKGLLKEYENSRATEARRNTQTWLKARYENADIQTEKVVVDPWSERPSKDHVEHCVNVTVKGVPRRNAVQFLWNVERMSTKMRTIEMKLTRVPPSNTQPEADVWDLKATFGYRVPRGMKEGGS